jgi:hypothetical protein
VGARFEADVVAHVNGRLRFESTAGCRPLVQKEQVGRLHVVDMGIAQQLDRMLQFVSDGRHQIASRRAASVHQNSKEARRAGYLHRQTEASPHAVSTLAFVDIHEAIGRRNRLDQASERRGPFGRVADEGGDGRVVGANSDEGGIGAVFRPKSSGVLNEEYFECEDQERGRRSNGRSTC